MLKPEYSLFLGKSDDKTFSGFVSENNVFLIVESEGTPIENGSAFLSLVKEKVASRGVSDLASFESLLVESARTANLPLGVSVAASYLHSGVAYLVTLGEGVIYLQREKQFVKIIQGNLTASGPVAKDDLYILTTTSFISLFSSEEQLKKTAIKNDVFSVVDAIYEEIGDKEDSGLTALFLSPLEVTESEVIITDSSVIVEEGEKETLLSSEKKHSLKVPFRLPAGKTKRVLTGVIVVVIFAVLIWSVVLGYGRRAEAELTKKVQTTTQKINSDLGEAESIYSSNPTHAVELIADAKSQLKDLKEAAGTEKTAEIAQLEQVITQKEGQITKKEEKAASEFYDLSIDTKDATAQNLYVDGNTAVLPDKAKKTVYILTLSKKSLDKRIASEVSQASLFSSYQDAVYLFIKDKGIFTLSGGNKVKKIIDTDKDWGDITDMQLYNGNIYLLDTGKNDIYKYLVADDSTYSAKQSYFKANADIRSGNSISIDSALYVGEPDTILKFNGGLPTDFSTTYPEGSVSIQKIVTTEALQKVYVWDKDSGTVYILGKTGEYDQQIHSSVMKTASDFAVSADTLYFLAGSKLYSVNL